MKNKRGAELAIGTLVIIVLAVIVLVVIVAGFATGWGNLWSNISAFFGGTNVDTIVKACKTACATQSEDAFCKEQRSITYTGTDGRKASLKGQTCNGLATNSVITNQGFELCPAIAC